MGQIHWLSQIGINYIRIRSIRIGTRRRIRIVWLRIRGRKPRFWGCHLVLLVGIHMSVNVEHIELGVTGNKFIDVIGLGQSAGWTPFL